MAGSNRKGHTGSVTESRHSRAVMFVTCTNAASMLLALAFCVSMIRAGDVTGRPDTAFARSSTLAPFTGRHDYGCVSEWTVGKPNPRLIDVDIGGNELRPQGLSDATREDLKKLTTLRTIRLYRLPWSTRATGECIRALADLPELRALWLDSMSFDTVSASALPALQQVHDLRIEGWPCEGITTSNWVFLYVRHMKNLRSLSVSHGAVTGTGLAHLRSLENLRYMNLAANPVSDAALGELAQLKSIEELDLRGTPVTVIGLRELRKLPSLRSLHLSRIDQKIAAALAEFPQLTELSLSTDVVTEDVADALGELRSLTAMELDGPWTGRTLARLMPRLPKLRRLEITGRWNARADEGACEAIGKHRGLRTIKLDCISITRQGLSYLIASGQVEELDLSMRPGQEVAADMMEELRQAKRLRSLTLRRARISADACRVVGRLQDIRQLSFRFCQLDENVDGLSGLKKLEELTLPAAPSLSMLRSIRSSGTLRRLDLTGTQTADGEARAIVEFLPQGAVLRYGEFRPETD